MKAFGYQQFGEPDVFEELALERPTLTSDHQVIVKTLAVGLNNFERMQRMGTFGGNQFPLIPGRDVVGEIVALGAAVTDYQIGDVVIGHAGPAYAEYVKIPTSRLVKKPASVTVAVAAGIITPGITAYNAVTAFTHVRAGDRVLINGVTGGVGLIAAQVAKSIGAYVAGIGSSRNQALLEALPLDEFGCYDRDDVNRKFKDQFDVVINAAMNGDNTRLISDAIRNGGRAASVGEATQLTEKPAVLFEHIRPLDAQHDQVALKALARLLTTHELDVPIFKTLPLTLAGVINGHQLLGQKHAPGRIILTR